MAKPNDKQFSSAGQVHTGTEPVGEGQRPSQADEGAHYVAGSGKPQGAGEKIRERMDVIASCGTKIGVVDRVEGGAIKLTKKDSPDDKHHFVPLNWVQRVDNHVHLSKNSEEAEHDWKPDAASCTCG